MAKSSAARAKPVPSQAEVRDEGAGKTLFPLQVKYYRRMHRQRVYTVTVSWHNPEERRPPVGAKPVVLRLLMAGAQVVPAEQSLDPAKTDAKANFFVTPLASGWLRNERLEVLVEGRKVQELPLPARVTSQKWTVFFLMLVFLVPWFLLSYGRYSPLKDPPRRPGMPRSPGKILEERIAENVPPLPGFVKDNLPAVQDGLVDFRTHIAKIYDRVWIETPKKFLPFYAALGFLILAFFSWLTHKAKRKRRLGKPILLPAADKPGLSLDDF